MNRLSKTKPNQKTCSCNRPDQFEEINNTWLCKHNIPHRCNASCSVDGVCPITGRAVIVVRNNNAVRISNLKNARAMLDTAIVNTSNLLRLLQSNFGIDVSLIFQVYQRFHAMAEGSINAKRGSVAFNNARGVLCSANARLEVLFFSLYKSKLAVPVGDRIVTFGAPTREIANFITSRFPNQTTRAIKNSQEYVKWYNDSCAYVLGWWEHSKK